jgi:hypothetical protein
VQPPDKGILSRTLFNDERFKVVLFGFAQGEELSEHTASMPDVLEGPFSRDKMRLGDLSTASESRSQEVVARSGFGLYGLGWLRRFAVSIPQETR